MQSTDEDDDTLAEYEPVFAALLDKNPRRFWTRREQAVDGHDYDLVIVDPANVGCPGNNPTIVSC